MTVRRTDQFILSGLTATVTAIAIVMAWSGRASWLEAASFVSGAICVWLTVKESVWNFPISLVNVSTFCVVFFDARLFADAGLQVVYFVLTIIGWRMWCFGGADRTMLRISGVARFEAVVVSCAGMTATIGLWALLRNLGSSAPFWDALTTSISLCAQWLLNRKKVESWYCWIAADLVYVPLYALKDLYLTCALYAVFLVMASMGLMRWRAAWRQQSLVPNAPHDVMGAVVKPETSP